MNLFYLVLVQHATERIFIESNLLYGLRGAIKILCRHCILTYSYLSHFLLNSTFDNDIMDMNLRGLAKSITSSLCLSMNRISPPRFHRDTMRGFCQIETLTANLVS